MRSIWAILLLLASTAQGQTLFSYGPHQVPVTEFLEAFEKNKTGHEDEKALREYLQLNIDARLKIQEARALRLDTLSQLKEEMQALRRQVAESYVVDKETIGGLMAEALERAREDVEVQHIFIDKYQEGSQEKLKLVQEGLHKNEDFGALAMRFSDDPAAPRNKGLLGWITVFSLPYELETLAYNTPAGKAAFMESTAGYHFLMPLQKRPAFGRVHTAQILLAFPPEATETQKQEVMAQAKGLYNKVRAGEDFAVLASQYSHHLVSAANGGLMEPWGPGAYDPIFEQAAMSLKAGEVSKPITTPYGVHLVKMIERSGPYGEADQDALQRLVLSGDRMDVMRSRLAAKILEKDLKAASFNWEGLRAVTDSAGGRSQTSSPIPLNTTLFHIGKQAFKVSDWIAFIQNEEDYPGTENGFQRSWKRFRENAAIDFYKANLEQYSPAFRKQMRDFEEGSLFFEIMQQKVWTPAQRDTVAQKKFFQQHKDSYRWQKSADAVIFYAPTAESASHFASHLNGLNWRAALNEHGDITADSARFEWTDLPGHASAAFAAGTITQPELTGDEQQVRFAYILKTYPQPQQRSFEEARAIVLGDYQDHLEKTWLASLRKKYPVVIHEAAWQQLLRSGSWKKNL